MIETKNEAVRKKSLKKLFDETWEAVEKAILTMPLNRQETRRWFEFELKPRFEKLLLEAMNQAREESAVIAESYKAPGCVMSHDGISIASAIRARKDAGAGK